MALRITQLYRPDLSTPLALRLFLCRVPAGFPSPADDYIDEFLDLNKKLITNKSATFLVRAEDNSMKWAGIFSGDLLIVGFVTYRRKNHHSTFRTARAVCRSAGISGS